MAKNTEKSENRNAYCGIWNMARILKKRGK
jgi:hypothetical protein